MKSYEVRAAERTDMAAICEVYNHYIVHTPATFDLEPFATPTWEELFDSHIESGPYHLLVAVEEGTLLGFAKTGEFRPKRAYDTSLQVSVYCAPEQTGRGIGTALYMVLFGDILSDGTFHRAYANITVPNDASVALHERFGFVHRGTLNEVGIKFGRHHDVATYEKALDRTEAVHS